MESNQDLKQIIFKNQGTIEDAREEMKTAIKKLYRLGAEIRFKRGNGIWTGMISNYGHGSHTEYLNVKSRTGKYHTVFINDII